MSAATRLPSGYQLAPGADWNAVGLNPPGNLSQWQIRSGYLVAPAGASPSPGLVVLKRGNRLIERWVVPKVAHPAHQARVAHPAAAHAHRSAESRQVHRAPAHHQARVRAVHHEAVHHSAPVLSETRQADVHTRPAPAPAPARPTHRLTPQVAPQVTAQGQPGPHPATPSPQGQGSSAGSPGAAANLSTLSATASQHQAQPSAAAGNSLPAAPHAIEIRSPAHQGARQGRSAASESAQGRGVHQAPTQRTSQPAASSPGLFSTSRHQIFAGGLVLMLAVIAGVLISKWRSNRAPRDDTMYYEDPDTQPRRRTPRGSKAPGPAPALRTSAGDKKPPPCLPEDEGNEPEEEAEMELSPEFARRVQESPDVLTAAECGMFDELDEDSDGPIDITPIDITPAAISFDLLEKAS